MSVSDNGTVNVANIKAEAIVDKESAYATRNMIIKMKNDPECPEYQDRRKYQTLASRRQALYEENEALCDKDVGGFRAQGKKNAIEARIEIIFKEIEEINEDLYKIFDTYGEHRSSYNPYIFYEEDLETALRMANEHLRMDPNDEEIIDIYKVEECAQLSSMDESVHKVESDIAQPKITLVPELKQESIVNHNTLLSDNSKNDTQKPDENTIIISKERQAAAVEEKSVVNAARTPVVPKQDSSVDKAAWFEIVGATLILAKAFILVKEVVSIMVKKMEHLSTTSESATQEKEGGIVSPRSAPITEKTTSDSQNIFGMFGRILSGAFSLTAVTRGLEVDDSSRSSTLVH